MKKIDTLHVFVEMWVFNKLESVIAKIKKKHIGFIYIVIDEEIKMNFNYIFTYKKPKMFCIHIPHSRINTSTWGMTHGV